jgi:alpha-D-ribose 1-methylphosphonate 5-triphosphate synthase subunit PhnG
VTLDVVDEGGQPAHGEEGRYGRERRSELLAASETAELVEMAERCLATTDTRVVGEPTVGTIPMCVREPVVGERFLLVDVLVTQAEVVHGAERGWAMRLGDDKLGAVAAAICDAAAATGAGLTGEIDALCRTTERKQAACDTAEWSELLPTEVHFEELG